MKHMSTLSLSPLAFDLCNLMAVSLLTIGTQLLQNKPYYCIQTQFIPYPPPRRNFNQYKTDGSPLDAGRSCTARKSFYSIKSSVISVV